MRLEDERYRSLDKAVDRHMDERQLDTGKRQVAIGKWAIFWASVIAVASAVMGAGAAVLLSRLIGTSS